MSWLKKNELEFKRNMAELRDSIKTNWSTTGQELSRDFKQFWQSSRPASPARTPTQERHENSLFPSAATAASPSAISRLGHLDIPRASLSNDRGSEFAAGYNLGLIGGVRSWVSDSPHSSQYPMYLPDDRWPVAGETSTTAGRKVLPVRMNPMQRARLRRHGDEPANKPRRDNG